ncbi:hypothetical protein B9479_008325, partial [Cryptococcus floricola]
MQQQIVDLLAREKSPPSPAHTHAPASSYASSGHTPEQPRLFKRPDKIVCPTLTRFTKDPFVVIRHVYALEAYIANARPSIDPEFFSHWLIAQCNSSISSVGQWVSWAREEGSQYRTFAEWSEAWKEKILDRDWVRQVRLSLSHKRMEGTNPRAFDAFSALVLDHRHLLKDSTDPLTDLEVKRALLAGLSNLLVVHIEDILDSQGRLLVEIPLPDLLYIIQKSVEKTHVQNEAIIREVQANLRPPFRPAPPLAPRTPPRPAYRSVNAIMTSSSPRQPTDTDVRVWTDPTIRLPTGPEGTRARSFLIQRGLCFGCRQHGHMVQSCPASLPQVASLSPGFPQSSAPPSPSPLAPLQESVPLLLVNARLDADGPSYQSLVDSGAAVNVIDEKLVEELGLATRKM